MASNGPKEVVQDDPRLPTPIEDDDNQLFINNDDYDADGDDADGNGADGSRPGSLFGGNGSDSDDSDVPMPGDDANAGGDPREPPSEPEAAGGGGSSGGDSSGDSRGESSGESNSGGDSEDSSDGSDDEDSDEDSDGPNGAAGSAHARRRAPIPPPLAGAVHFECNRNREIILADRYHYRRLFIQARKERKALVIQVRGLEKRLREKENGHTQRVRTLTGSLPVCIYLFECTKANPKCGIDVARHAPPIAGRAT